MGFNDYSFEEYTKTVKAMGERSGAYKDLRLAFINFNGRPYRSLDILNHFFYEKRGGSRQPFHNADFLWPVITYLGSYLSKRGMTFDYVNLFHLEKEKLREKLLNEDILTIAITTTLYVSPHPILEIISFIRKYNQTAKIIVGGPYIANQIKITDHVSNQHLFKYLEADFYVTSSEGEMALVNILKALKTGGDLNRVDNIAYRIDDEYIVTQPSIESNPLEENPINYRLFSAEEIDEFVTLRTAKSCPFSCSFCGFPARAGSYKYVGVELVEQELNEIREIGGVTTLTFIDDTFNVPKARFKDVLRMMIRNNYGFKWNCFYRSDHGDEETIELMGKAGCEGVFLGVESGSDRMLELMNKTARRKDYVRAIPLLKAAGISTYASLIVGFPGETYETYRETVEFIETARPDFFRAQLWYSDPITPIWQQKEKLGIRGSAFNWSHHTMDSEMACDLIDNMFLCIENSIWLPQFGFEQWSTFYLQRKGMTLSQIKTFLKCFNAIIKQDLVQPGRDMDPALLESLRASSQFDRGERPEMRSVEALSGTHYQAAEHFWKSEFRNASSDPHLTKLLGTPATTASGWSSVPVAINFSEITAAAADCNADPSSLILAVYSNLISMFAERKDIVILCAISQAQQAGIVPLRLFPSGDVRFSEYLLRLQQLIAQSLEHKLFAFYFITNQSHMAECHGSCPVFDVGYSFNAPEAGDRAFGVEEVLRFHSQLERNLSMLLNVARAEDGLNAQLWYSTDSFDRNLAEGVAALLEFGLHSATEKGDFTLSEITFEARCEQNSPVIEAITSEAFNF